MCNIFHFQRGQKLLKFISQSESSKYRVKRLGSDILIRFPLESSFWIYISCWNLTT